MLKYTGVLHVYRSHISIFKHTTYFVIPISAPTISHTSNTGKHTFIVLVFEGPLMLPSKEKLLCGQIASPFPLLQPNLGFVLENPEAVHTIAL